MPYILKSNLAYTILYLEAVIVMTSWNQNLIWFLNTMHTQNKRKGFIWAHSSLSFKEFHFCRIRMTYKKIDSQYLTLNHWSIQRHPHHVCFFLLLQYLHTPPPHEVFYGSGLLFLDFYLHFYCKSQNNANLYEILI